MTPTISVALCTYNGARFIEEQLRSVLSQTLPPNEIVLSDDASSDATVGLAQATVAAFLAGNPAVTLTLRVLRNPAPLGVIKNFEQAATACEGDLIALCDQDDRWDPKRLATVVEEFRARPDLLLLHGDARLIKDDGSPLGYSLFQSLAVTPREKRLIGSGNGFSALLGRNLVTGTTTIFRRELLGRAVPFPHVWVHDEWLAIIAAASGRIDFLTDQLVDYRQHDGNEIGARKLSLRDRVRKFREPREERNQNLVDRAEVLLERVIALGDLVPPANVEKARAKLIHERFRLNLPGSRWRRVRPVLREAAAGQYSRFSRGRIDAVRDLVQPAGEAAS